MPNLEGSAVQATTSCENVAKESRSIAQKDFVQTHLAAQQTEQLVEIVRDSLGLLVLGVALGHSRRPFIYLTKIHH